MAAKVTQARGDIETCRCAVSIALEAVLPPLRGPKSAVVLNTKGRYRVGSWLEIFVEVFSARRLLQVTAGKEQVALKEQQKADYKQKAGESGVLNVKSGGSYQEMMTNAMRISLFRACGRSRKWPSTASEATVVQVISGKEDIRSAVVAKAEAEDFLRTSRAKCVAEAEGFRERSGARQEELAAISKAGEVLEGKSSKPLSGAFQSALDLRAGPSFNWP